MVLANTCSCNSGAVVVRPLDTGLGAELILEAIRWHSRVADRNLQLMAMQDAMLYMQLCLGRMVGKLFRVLDRHVIIMAGCSIEASGLYLGFAAKTEEDTRWMMPVYNMICLFNMQHRCSEGLI
jgi:hypothetical protein